MNVNDLENIVKKIMVKPKGILAADESTGTIKKRFDNIGVANTESNRQSYHELLFTAPGIDEYISGVILFDETIRQSTKSGKKFVDLLNAENIIPGIKVDQGLVPYNNSEVESETTGLDGLSARLKEYYSLGARFAKWRAIYTISAVLPSAGLIDKNAKDLAVYARRCQAENIVPIVEPEVLMDGAHTIERCFEVTKAVLQAVFRGLKNEDVYLPGIILKPNMVISGSECVIQATPAQVAEETLKCFDAVVPVAVPGIVFLSGGQSEQQACENLQAISEQSEGSPWELSFSYGRALQDSTLQAWQGKEENIRSAQEAFLKQAERVSAARSGKYRG